MTVLIAVRHGESTANAALAAAQGRDADIPLTARGREQSTLLARELLALPFPERVLCSPYVRCRETARIIADEHARAGRPLPEAEYDERLRDREMGILELLTAAAIRDRHPEEAARREQTGDFHYRPPGGESLADVGLRVRSVLGGLDDRGVVLFVVHDAVVLMLRYLLEELGEGDVLTAEPVGNASITRWIVAKSSISKGS